MFALQTVNPFELLSNLDVLFQASFQTRRVAVAPKPKKLTKSNECAVCFDEDAKLEKFCTNSRCHVSVCKQCLTASIGYQLEGIRAGFLVPLSCPGCKQHLPHKLWSQFADSKLLGSYEKVARSVLSIQCGGCHTRTSLFLPTDSNAAVKHQALHIADPKFTRQVSRYVDGKLSVMEMGKILSERAGAECAAGIGVLKQEKEELEAKLEHATQQYNAWEHSDGYMQLLRATKLVVASEATAQSKVYYNAMSALQEFDWLHWKYLPTEDVLFLNQESTNSHAKFSRYVRPAGVLDNAGKRAIQDMLDDEEETWNYVQEDREPLIRAALEEKLYSESLNKELNEFQNKLAFQRSAMRDELQLETLSARLTALLTLLDVEFLVHASINSVLNTIPDIERRTTLQLRMYRLHNYVPTPCCQKVHCFVCKTKGKHTGQTCDTRWGTNNKIVNCEQCSIPLVKGDGCSMVTCVCGHRFSWPD